MKACTSINDDSHKLDTNSKSSKKVVIQDNKVNVKNDGKTELINVGSNFLHSLTPGYTKQQVFGDVCGFGAASEIDLDELISQTLGYDQYEKNNSTLILTQKLWTTFIVKHSKMMKVDW